MKGDILVIKSLAYTALLFAFIMVLLNLYPSWSQYALTLESPLLTLTLGSLWGMFLLRASSHPEKRRILFKVPFLNKDIRFEHLNRYTGFLFLCIAATPVTHKEWYIETLHLIFTALAILSAYLQLYFYYTSDNLLKIASRVSILIGLFGFTGAYLFHYYSIGLGELIIALTLIVFILTTNKQ